MGETLFWCQQTQAFLTAHPHEQGWKVYSYPGEAAERVSLFLLPDYLRDICPEVITHRAIVREVDVDELMGTPGKSHAAEPGSAWDLKHDLNGTGWKGQLHLHWQEHPIHVLAFPLAGQYGLSDIFMVATRSNSALRSFHSAIAEYVRTVRGKTIPQEIFVVNGEDIRIRPVSWDDVMLPAGMAQDIRSNVHAFFQGGALYRQLGLPHRRGFLFAGPPGCGKTATLRALATNVPARFIALHGRFDVSDYHIDRALSVAQKSAPAVVLLEDIDKLVASETISLGHLLNTLDGLQDADGILIIATANEPHKLDPALLHRPSRFDRIWKFPLPRYDQRLALLGKLAAGRYSHDTLRKVAGQSDGFSMAYIQEIVVNAVLQQVEHGVPDDVALLKSMEVIRSQRRSAGKVEDDVAAHDRVGFCSPV